MQQTTSGSCLNNWNRWTIASLFICWVLLCFSFFLCFFLPSAFSKWVWTTEILAGSDPWSIIFNYDTSMHLLCYNGENNVYYILKHEIAPVFSGIGSQMWSLAKGSMRDFFPPHWLHLLTWQLESNGFNPRLNNSKTISR